MALPPALSGKRLAELGERLSRPVGVLLSLVLLVVVLRQARAADWSVIAGSAQLSVAFWPALLAYYFTSPCAEWLVYSRLWGFEPRAFPALLRKLVCNELLLDYLGDVQFLAWARSHHAGAVAPFAAVKDVSLLSALTGNLVTVALTAFAWPYIGAGVPGVPVKAIVVSLCVVVAGSSLVILFGRRIFSHGVRTLLWIAAVLTLRTLTGLTLGAVLWHLLMPGTALTGLLLLATFRMIVSRLPLVPSKELLFAGLTVLAFGHAADISEATSMIASLVLLLHILIGSALAITHVVTAHRRRTGAAPSEPGA